MTSNGRSKVSRGGGTGRGRGNFKSHGFCGARSSLSSHPPIGHRVENQVQTQPIHENELQNNHHQVPSPETRRSLESQASRNLEDDAHLNLIDESRGDVAGSKKRGRGQYKSKYVIIHIKNGKKISIYIPPDIDRAVGKGARKIVNYCGLIVRKSVSFRDGTWQKIFSKHGEAMWLKVQHKFETCASVREHVFKGFVISTMQRLFRNWKARLHSHYKKLLKAQKNVFSHCPDDIEPTEWKHLIQHFESDKFKAASERNKKNREKQTTKHTCGTKSFAEIEEETRDPETGEKALRDIIWEIQHTHKNDKGEVVFLDPQSEQIHVQLKELVAEQQAVEDDQRMSSDQMLASVLGEKSGYVRGKGYGKKPPRKNRANIEDAVSSAVEVVREEMQLEMELKLQEDREQLTAEWNNKLEEERAERARMELEMEKKFATLMAMIQQRPDS